MAFTKLEEWSETAGSNTEINGIPLSDSTQIDQLDNIEREHMSQIAKWLGDDTLASAGTTDLGSVAGRYVIVTGTTTITAFGTIKAGTIKYVKFAGAITLTHNATSLILPGAANITTAAGDTAIFVSEGSGNWRCVTYQRASGSSVVLGTAQASTSGAAITFTGVPSWARQITVSLVGVSWAGASSPFIQIGDAGGLEATGYLGSGGELVGAAAATRTDGFAIGQGLIDSAVLHGSVTITLVDASTNTWAAFGVVALSNTGQLYLIGGSKSLSATLDRVSVTSSGGFAFDAGTINIAYS